MYRFFWKSLDRDPFLWLFWRSCSLDEFLFINNGPLKGQVSSFQSCFVHDYLTPLLLSPHKIQPSFRHGIYEVLAIWYNLDWYCWLVFLWVCWCLFGPFWCWNVFTKFRLTMGSIIWWEYFMSVSAISRVTKTSSIVGVDLVESWWLCGRRSSFLSYSSKGVICVCVCVCNTDTNPCGVSKSWGGGVTTLDSDLSVPSLRC